jgi:hypothetical protein
MLTYLKQLICRHKGLEGKHIYHEENGVKCYRCSWCDKDWEDRRIGYIGEISIESIKNANEYMKNYINFQETISGYTDYHDNEQYNKRTPSGAK